MKQRYDSIYYVTSSLKRQNFLAENGIYPDRENGNTASYLKSDRLFSLLDRYLIIESVFGGKY